MIEGPRRVEYFICVACIPIPHISLFSVVNLLPAASNGVPFPFAQARLASSVSVYPGNMQGKPNFFHDHYFDTRIMFIINWTFKKQALHVLNETNVICKLKYTRSSATA